MPSTLVSPDAIRTAFSSAMSDMYKAEVPRYGALLGIVAEVNAEVLATGQVDLAATERSRLNLERHGAIRLGTPRELRDVARLFALMGMQPVGYYDLSMAGVPVHSTAFRPIDEASLAANPFRVFTSLLRLELIADAELRAQAQAILDRRAIFTPRCLHLMDRAEAQGGLNAQDAAELTAQALETFRWHGQALAPLKTYERLRAAHPLVADVVSFHGPHINHLTPRTLDIDRAQRAMRAGGLLTKATIEGPPPRRCPILLRQTSFKALSETVAFADGAGGWTDGAHTARFGEIEARGVALTPKGRALYDRLLAQAMPAPRSDDPAQTAAFEARLATAFAAFPDDHAQMRDQGLAYYRYAIVDGAMAAEPVIYEDFLPVSAAGIFRSNLGDEILPGDAIGPDQAAFEQALGPPVHDPFVLYAQVQARSRAECAAKLGSRTKTEAIP